MGLSSHVCTSLDPTSSVSLMDQDNHFMCCNSYFCPVMSEEHRDLFPEACTWVTGWVPLAVHHFLPALRVKHVHVQLVVLFILGLWKLKKVGREWKWITTECLFSPAVGLHNLNLMTIPWECYYYPHLTDEKTENHKKQGDAQVLQFNPWHQQYLNLCFSKD